MDKKLTDPKSTRIKNEFETEPESNLVDVNMTQPEAESNDRLPGPAATQKTKEILEEKTPNVVLVQVNKWINIAYLIHQFVKIQAKQ